ncbi:hypothetical protein LguiA_008221 [Lonicera macranthoides]
MNDPFLFGRYCHHCGFATGAVSPSLLKEVPLSAGQKSYAGVVDVQKLATPNIKGNEVMITPSEMIYQQSVLECRSNLIGKIFFSRGSASVSAEAVCQQVRELWKLNPGWRIVPIAVDGVNVDEDRGGAANALLEGGKCSGDHLFSVDNGREIRE